MFQIILIEKCFKNTWGPHSAFAPLVIGRGELRRLRRYTIPRVCLQCLRAIFVKSIEKCLSHDVLQIEMGFKTARCSNAGYNWDFATTFSKLRSVYGMISSLPIKQIKELFCFLGSKSSRCNPWRFWFSLGFQDFVTYFAAKLQIWLSLQSSFSSPLHESIWWFYGGFFPRRNKLGGFGKVCAIERIDPQEK